MRVSKALNTEKKNILFDESALYLKVFPLSN